MLEHLTQDRAGVPQEGGPVRVIASELERIDIELNDRRARGGNLPAGRDLAAGVAAHEENEVGFEHEFVGAGARVRADHAHVVGVVVHHTALAIQTGGERNTQSLCECQRFGLRAGRGHATADHHDRPFGSTQGVERAGDISRLGGGSERGHTREAVLHNDLGRRDCVGGVALLAGELQVRRTGCTACGGAKSLPQEVRQPVDGLDPRTEFGDLAKHREVVAQLLVAVAVACARGGASRQRDRR